MEKQIQQQSDNKLIAQNFFAFNDFSKSENGNYKVSGLLSILDNEIENLNGYVYHSGCYNKFCKNYYEANGKNIPLDVLHNTWTLDHLAGKVTEFTAKDNEVRIVAEVSKSAIRYENIVGLIEDGVLQGFSDYSFIGKYDFDKEKELLHVYECFIQSVTLTTNPAVVKSQLETMNATKFNFNGKKKEDEEETKNSIGIFGLNL